MLNHITIMGRLTTNPILRRTASGTPVTSFTLAVDRDYSKDGEKDTDFIECVAWRGTGEFVDKHFKKGSMAVVSGRLQSRKWQDKEGNNRTNWEVNVDSIYFGESKRADANTSHSALSATGYAQSGGQTFTEIEDDDSELPF